MEQTGLPYTFAAVLTDTDPLKKCLVDLLKLIYKVQLLGTQPTLKDTCVTKDE